IAHHADVVRMPNANCNFGGLFWRFLVADDPSVDRYIIRDADSVVNTQERVAVDLWIESSRHFHVMRDWCSHTEPILAGMWGGVRGALPRLDTMIQEFVTDITQRISIGRIIDQVFLRTKIWPIVRKSVLQHDSIFGFAGADDFPIWGRR